MQIPFIQVRNNCLLYYTQPACRPPRGKPKFGKKAYSGNISNGAKKRIDKAIDILLQKSPPRIIFNSVTKRNQTFTINFVTLTISSMKNIGIQEGYKNLLKPFIRKIRSRGPVSYVWKAEFQQRGQLHYHITTNTFIPWQTIRNDWNNIQRKGRYLDEYAVKHGHFDANSTDIHAVYKIGDIGAYLRKYMQKPVIDPTKQKKGQVPVIEKGKVWDCSTDLKGNRFAYIMDSRTDNLLEKGIKSGQIKVIELEHCTIFKMKNPTHFIPVSEYKNYLSWRR